MLSVALCTYNGERFIREQLESILNQTMHVDEIVVCDDGSNDNTLQIIESLHKNTITDIRIYRNEKNLGPAHNFQKAINLCQGNIIFLSDQDDVWRKDKVETIVRYFSRNEQKKVVFTDGLLIDTYGNAIQSGTLWKCFGMTTKGQKMIDEGYGIELFSNENRATGATMAVRRDYKYLPHIVDYCKGDILHDGVLAMLSVADNQLGYINELLINYRVHPAQECGVGESQLHPVSDNPRESSYTAVLWNQNSLPPSLDRRIKFIITRQRRQHQPLGPFRMIGDIKEYKTLYRTQWCRFLLFDIKTSISVILHRIVK